MMPAPRRKSCLLLLAASLALAPACIWDRVSGRPTATSTPARMSGPEASRAIARARELLSARRAGNPDAAIRLADGVIANCDVPRYVSEGFLLKAAAYRARNEHENAAAAARIGVHRILTSPRGRPDPAMFTALKMLLAAYVESAVVGNDREDVLPTLKGWKAELRALYEADNTAVAGEVEAVDETFDLLAEMAEQHIASRAPEVATQEVVRRYIRLFNARGKDDLGRLFAPEGAQAKLIAERGAGALLTGQVDQLGLGSAIKVVLSDGKPARTAVATCDLIAVSNAGWASVVRGVTFSLERADDSSWLIREIVGLP